MAALAVVVAVGVVVVVVTMDVMAVPPGSVARILAISNFPDFLRRLQSLITTTENPQILVILCQNEARGGT